MSVWIKLGQHVRCARRNSHIASYPGSGSQHPSPDERSGLVPYPGGGEASFCRALRVVGPAMAPPG
jgi:hypothetical protein